MITGLMMAKNKTLILKNKTIKILNAAWNENIFSDLVEACSTPRKVTVDFN